MTPVRMGEYLEIEDSSEGRVVRCRKCGHTFCGAGSNYKEFALMSEHPLTRSSPRNSTTERFVLREFYCPGCATQLDVETVLKGSPLIHSYRLRQ
mgnify:CR=1 FL=1|jgi:acetone carboxylase gamma subunit